MHGSDQKCWGEYTPAERSINIWLKSRNHEKKKVGVLPKDTTTGPFADDWKRAFANISGEVEEVDISPALSAAFAVKDTDELVRPKTHSLSTFVANLETGLD